MTNHENSLLQVDPGGFRPTEEIIASALGRVSAGWNHETGSYALAEVPGDFLTNKDIANLTELVGVVEDTAEDPSHRTRMASVYISNLHRKYYFSLNLLNRQT